MLIVNGCTCSFPRLFLFNDDLGKTVTRKNNILEIFLNLFSKRPTAPSCVVSYIQPFKILKVL